MSVQQHKNWANNCNNEQKPYYYPWEAALRWCELFDAEPLIMGSLEGLYPSREIATQLKAPCLRQRTETIIHALENNKMPWCRDGKLCPPSDKPAAHRLSVLHEDLKKWVAENYPEQKPKFLFDEIERTTHSAITLEAYQTLQTENKRLEIENKDMRDRLEKGRGFYSEIQRQLVEASARIAELEAIQPQQQHEISPKSKAPIAATFKAIRALAPDLTIDAIEAQTQLDDNPVSRSTIANYLKGNI